MYKWVLFDFDGTIADSSEGIISSIEYAEKAMGIPPCEKRDLHELIGPPLYEMIKKVYPRLTEQQKNQMVGFYREAYADNGKRKLRIYDGIRELFAELRARGVSLAVVSSKPEKFLREICGENGITQYFRSVIGVSLGENAESKAFLIERLMARNLISADSAVMVGDSAGDCAAAHANGVRCVAVTYGFGRRDELFAQKPEFTAGSVAELRTLLLA